MSGKIRILLLSANPLPTGRILVDLEAREIDEKLEQGPYRDKFELHKYEAIQPVDIQKLLLKHRPHIVHFCGHGHKTEKIFLAGAPGRAKTIDKQGLAQVFALYNGHVRLVVLNACYTNAMARSITNAVDYAVGTGKGIGDKAAVAFAGGLYRALGFGNSVKEAFASAKAELGLTKMPRAQGIELFVRDGLNEGDSFPRLPYTGLMVKTTGLRSVCRITVSESLTITRSGKGRVCLRRQKYVGVQA
jgi:CHAT domain